MKKNVSVFIIILLIIILNPSLYGNTDNVDEYSMFATGDTLNTRLAGGWFSGSCDAVFAVDSIAFVGDGGYVRIFNAADPYNPVELSKYRRSGFVEDIYVQDTLAFIAVGNDGVEIVNISDLSNPVYVSTILGTRICTSVAAKDSLVYIGAGGSGIYIINIADPYAAVQVGLYDSPGGVRDFYMVDTLIYIGDGSQGLRIVNAADVTNPVSIGWYDTANDCMNVCVKDTVAYVCDYTNGLYFLNVSDPTNPTLITTLIPVGWAYENTIKDTILYVANGVYTYALNVADPSNPSTIDSFHTDDASKNISCQGDMLVLGNTSGGFKFIDISSSSDLTIAYEYETGGSVLDIEVKDSLAFLAEGPKGCVILNISDPQNIEEVGVCEPLAYFYAIEVLDTILYAADGGGGLRIFNINDPANPAFINWYNTPGNGFDIAVVDTLALIADGSSGLRIIDVSDPSTPVEAGYIDSTYYVEHVAVFDTLAFVTDSWDTLRIINIADPSNPVEIHSEGFTDDLYKPVVKDTFLYIPNDAVGVRIFSISDPAAMYEISTYDPGNLIRGVFVEDTILYIANAFQGLSVASINDPAAPYLTGSYDTAEQCNNVFVVYPFVYAADDADGMYIIKYPSDALIPCDLYGTVSLSDNPADSSWSFVEIPELAISDTTDTHGYYEFTGIADGIYTVVFSRVGYNPDTASVVLNMDTEYNITLNPLTYILSGTVGLSDSPADSSNSIIEIAELAIADTTDIHGYYEFPAIVEDVYTVIFSHAGYVTDTVIDTVDASHSLDITLIKAVSYYSITGTVGLDDNPADSSGSIVEIVELAVTDTTNAHGAYGFGSIEEGIYTLAFEHSGYSPDTIIDTLDGNHIINITLSAVAGLGLRVQNLPVISGIDLTKGICFTYNKTDDKPSTVNVFDVTGRTVFKRGFSEKGVYSISHTSYLPSGKYYLLINEAEKQHKKKLLIIR